MVDSVAVFDPAYRVTNNSTGAPSSGAVIKFYVGGTAYGTPKPVYADAALETVLGTSVTTDSLGCPTSDGSTPTLIYTDTSSYDIRIETSAGALIKAYPNVKGAVPTGTGDSGDATLATTVETKSLDYTVVAADQNKIFRVNCSGGDVELEFPSAAASTIGNGWGFWAEHAGSASQAIFTASGSETFTDGVTNYGGTFVLTASGEGCRFTSDGGNWVVSQHTPPAIKAGSTILTIADRLAAAPGSPPAQGAMYIATGAATWGTTSVANHDVVMHTTAGAYVKFTPPTDCGWIGYVQDEDEEYQFQGSAWVQKLNKAATQAQQEAGSSALAIVTPAVQHLHPSAAKCWAYVTYSGGTPTLATSYNITSITDTATGRLTITIGTDFSSADWAALAMTRSTTTSQVVSTLVTAQAAGSVEIISFLEAVGLTDPLAISFAGYGDHA